MVKGAKGGSCLAKMQLPCLQVGKVFHGLIPEKYCKVYTVIELTSTKLLDVVLGIGWKRALIQNQTAIVVFTRDRKSRKGALTSQKCPIFSCFQANFLNVYPSFAWLLVQAS
mmetsp:Transcript_7217/g.12317  ORF Transcript_7217/g.12317 Transcript_7217/m.12317 type:complete len:112 (+) Transcript_7217:350-685(+)